MASFHEDCMTSPTSESGSGKEGCEKLKLEEADFETADSNQIAPLDQLVQDGNQDNSARKTPAIGIELIPSGKVASPNHCELADSHLTTPSRTQWLRSGPASGILCILLACCSMLASLAVLVVSHNTPTASWKYEPSTYLAICTAVGNQSMRYATVVGVVIAWWVRALRGSTLAQLHQYWQAGFTVRGAISAGRHMGFLGMASIFSTLVAIDGPLLQRASTVISVPRVDVPVPLNVSIAPEIPTNFTGGWGIVHHVLSEWNRTVPSSNGSTLNDVEPSIEFGPFDQVVYEWIRNSPINSGAVRGCGGVCKAKVKAPALAIESCATKEVAIDWKGPWRPTPGTDVSYGVPLNHMGLFVDAGVLVQGREKINLVTGFSTSVRCAGSLSYTACTLEAAIGEYDVTISSDNTVTIDGPPRILATANNTKASDPQSRPRFRDSTLGGIVMAFLEKWSSACWFYGAENHSVYGRTSGYACQIFQLPKAKGFCPSYTNPQESVMTDLDQLMFRTGAMAATLGSGDYHTPLGEHKFPINSTVAGSVQGNHDVFHTSFKYFVAAAVVELVCIAFVLPTYYGWWRLRRRVSLSPLEIAKVRRYPAKMHKRWVRKWNPAANKNSTMRSYQPWNCRAFILYERALTIVLAFDAPILHECSSNATGNELVHQVGAVRVRYGMNEEGKLALNPRAAVGHWQDRAGLEA